MIVTLHQPDFLPYSGFWYKMAKADVFDLKIYDQFVERGYQRRVLMRGRWLSIPIVGGASTCSPINSIRIDPVKTAPMLQKAITGRYGGSPFWKARREWVLELVSDPRTDLLWQFNFNLILGVRNYLGIETPVAVSIPPRGGKNEGVISVLKAYRDPIYLSGAGAKTYMGDCREYSDAGIPVVFSPHKAATPDSILSVIFDYEDPLDIVMAEEADGWVAARRSQT